MNILYYPGKANIIADTLSRLSMSSTSHVEEGKRELAKEVDKLAQLECNIRRTMKAGSIFIMGLLHP